MNLPVLWLARARHAEIGSISTCLVIELHDIEIWSKVVVMWLDDRPILCYQFTTTLAGPQNMSRASSTPPQKITNATSMGPAQTAGASGSVGSTSDSNQQSLGSCMLSGGYIHWRVDEDRATIRLVDLDVKRFSDATLVKSLLGVYTSVRGWANWWSMSACIDVAFIR